eukprot:m.705993 g.705993  ORF g.705993 m.705993 type:complete len:53 (-) comp58723_c0_seq91:61-219(-)
MSVSISDEMIGRPVLILKRKREHLLKAKAGSQLLRTAFSKKILKRPFAEAVY